MCGLVFIFSINLSLFINEIKLMIYKTNENINFVELLKKKDHYRVDFLRKRKIFEKKRKKKIRKCP